MTLLYSFFIIIDTDDPSSFWVEMTKMNYRLRFSALKSNHIRKYGKQKNLGIHTASSDPEKNELPRYHNVLRSNYTFYLLEKRQMSSEQANEHKLNLINLWRSKNAKLTDVDKFKISF